MRLVDSSVWIQFLRAKGDSKIKHRVARLIESDQAAYTCPIHFELLSGVKASEEQDLQQAISLCHHIPFVAEDWRAAASLENQLRGKGLVVPRHDLFVVTVAPRCSLPVICRDAHFDLAKKAVGKKLEVEQL